MRKSAVLLMLLLAFGGVSLVSCQSSSFAVLAVDRNGRGLAGATIRLSWDGSQREVVADERGIANFSDVGAGSYNVKVFWGGVQVLDTLFNYNGTALPVPFACNVFRLSVSVVDGVGDPVSGANVTVRWNVGNVVFLFSNSSGWAVFHQIPSGSVQVEAVLGSVSSGEDLVLDRNKPVFLSLGSLAGVYKVSVEVRDEEGLLADGARVRLWRGNGLLRTAFSVDGFMVFYSVEPGLYRVEVYWRDEKREADVEVVDRDVAVVVSFKEEGGLWFLYALIAAVVVLAACVAVYYYVGRRRRRIIQRTSPSRSAVRKPTVTKTSMGSPGVAQT